MTFTETLQDAVRGEFHELSKLLIDHGGRVWTDGQVMSPYICNRRFGLSMPKETLMATLCSHLLNACSLLRWTSPSSQVPWYEYHLEISQN